MPARSDLSIIAIAASAMITSVLAGVSMPAHARDLEGARQAVNRTKIDHDRTAMSSIFVEGFGPGGLYSVNYDRIVYKFISARIGFSYAPVHVGTTAESFKANMVTIPVLLNGLAGARGHYFEAGIGPAFRFYSDASAPNGLPGRGLAYSVVAASVMGYRMQSLHSGISLRIGFSPFFGKNAGFNARTGQTKNVAAWGYVSIGMSL